MSGFATRAPSPVTLLGAETATLARGLPPAPAGTLFVLGEVGGVRVEPRAGFTVVFGRNEPEVHVCVGADDKRVSRQHGLLHPDRDGWAIRNTGQVPIRFPGSQLLLAGHEEPLPMAYTPLFIRTSRTREHLLEVRVATGSTASAGSVAADTRTADAQPWRLSAIEQLVVVCLGQRYLRHEPRPQPLTWAQVAAELGETQPGQNWTSQRAAMIVHRIRERLTVQVPGLTREEIAEPVGNTLNHNLLVELLTTATIVPPDVRQLG